MEGDNSLNFRNWGYYEPTPSLKGHLGLQLMSSVPEKPLLNARSSAGFMASGNGVFHHSDFYSMEYMRDAWISHRDKFLNILPQNPNYTVMSGTSSAHMPINGVTPDISKNGIVDQVEEAVVESNSDSVKKKRGQKTPKSLNPKKTKKEANVPKGENGSSGPRARLVRKSAEVVINGIDMDISGIPIPVCSCTGTPQHCYRWGSGGWQSACCTTNLSTYPLPMSSKRRGARIAGRKMSIGAFKKVLERLASEGYDFSKPIDLKTHWAKHGTNKFVTIR